jgi:hypothetical protein
LHALLPERDLYQIRCRILIFNGQNNRYGTDEGLPMRLPGAKRFSGLRIEPNAVGLPDQRRERLSEKRLTIRLKRQPSPAAPAYILRRLATGSLISKRRPS